MRIVFVILMTVFATTANAQVATPYSGTKIIETDKPFATFVRDLRTAIRANRMGIVAEACATCGAKSLGITIPGNTVIMVFNPKFAVRMLKLSTAAGIEAPLRFYVTEQKNGDAQLTYRLPSHVFKAYQVPALTDMGRELDGVLSAIVTAALK